MSCSLTWTRHSLAQTLSRPNSSRQSNVKYRIHERHVRDWELYMTWFTYLTKYYLVNLMGSVCLSRIGVLICAVRIPNGWFVWISRPRQIVTLYAQNLRKLPNFCRINGAYFGAVLKLHPLSPLVCGGAFCDFAPDGTCVLKYNLWGIMHEISFQTP